MLPELAQGDANKVFVIPSEFASALGGIGEAFHRQGLGPPPPRPAPPRAGDGPPPRPRAVKPPDEAPPAGDH